MRSVLAGIEKQGQAHLPHLRIFARLGSLDKLEQLAGWEGPRCYCCGEACGIGVGVGEGFAKTIGAVAIMPFPS